MNYELTDQQITDLVNYRYSKAQSLIDDIGKLLKEENNQTI